MLRPKRTLPDLLLSTLRDPLRVAADKHQKRKIVEKERLIKRFYQKTHDEKKAEISKLLTRVLISASRTKFYSTKLTGDLIEAAVSDPRYLIESCKTTKNDLLNCPEDFIVDRESDANARIYESYTNGSTGPRAKVVYDQDAADWSSATTWFCRSLYTSRIKNTTLHLASDLIDNSRPLPTIEDWLRHLSTNRYNLFLNNFNEQNIVSALRSISGKKFALVHGHPTTMLMLCEALKRYNIAPPVVSMFESSGETLDRLTELNISSTLQCLCLNRYGMAEFGVIGYQTPNSSDYLRLLDHAIIPHTEQRDGGTLVGITGLRNTYFPLIAYDCGDSVVTNNMNGAWYCERPSGRLHRVLNLDGREVSTVHIMDVLTHRCEGVVDFQIDLRNKDMPLIRICESHAKKNKPSFYKHILRLYCEINIEVEICGLEDLIRLGHRHKFSHIVES